MRESLLQAGCAVHMLEARFGEVETGGGAHIHTLSLEGLGEFPPVRADFDRHGHAGRGSRARGCDLEQSLFGQERRASVGFIKGRVNTGPAFLVLAALDVQVRHIDGIRFRGGTAHHNFFAGMSKEGQRDRHRLRCLIETVLI